MSFLIDWDVMQKVDPLCHWSFYLSGFSLPPLRRSGAIASPYPTLRSGRLRP